MLVPLIFLYFTNMSDYTKYFFAAEDALANFLGDDDIDQDMINLVANCCVDAVAAMPDESYFESLLEKSSTYVYADMSVWELQNYVNELETQLVTYGLV
jgi:hypothetical protein